MEPARVLRAFIVIVSISVSSLGTVVIAATNTSDANAATKTSVTPPATQSETFLNSLYTHARIHAGRMQVAARHIFLAHPSLLQRWKIINADGAAHYNSLTNTLILQPEMTILDPALNRQRLRTLSELHESVGFSARVSAAIMFHELSHAEWDLYVEEGATDEDRELLKVFETELPKIVRANGLSKYSSFFLASEIFAYYREELISSILSDVTEIKFASGLEPDTNACFHLKRRPAALRDISPNPQSYEARARLSWVWVLGHDVNLDLDREANDRLHAALYRHARQTILFPDNRADLFQKLSEDSALRRAMAVCESQN